MSVLSKSILRRWLRSPWLTFGVFISAIIIPTVCVVWLIGRATENEQAALVQAYVDVQRRELVVLRDQLLGRFEDSFDTIDSWQGNADATETEVGWILKPRDLIVEENAPDAQSMIYLEELRYLDQMFGVSAVTEQIQFWLGAGNLEGLTHSGGRSLKHSILLMGMQMNGPSSDHFKELLRAELMEALKDGVSGDRYQLFLLRALQEHGDEEDSGLNAGLKGESAALLFNSEIEGIWQSPESQIVQENGWVFRKSKPERGNDFIWFISVSDLKEKLLMQAESMWEGIPGSLEVLEPGIEVNTEDPMRTTVSFGSAFPGWRLQCRIDEHSLVNPTRKRTLFYLWVGMIATVASIGFALIGMGLIRREISVAKLKNDLAATVSHELKTPIASVRILVDTLLDGGKVNDPKTHEYLELIRNENHRLGLLVEKFLTFSKIERGGYFMELEKLNANDIIEEASRIFRERFPLGDYELEMYPLDGNAWVSADAQGMLAALGNLLENAYKYTKAPRLLELSVVNEDRFLTLEVKDNGEGIDAVEQKRIFRQFYQPDRRLNQHRGGVGLGLSIVAYVVKQHKGRIDLKSEPGKGSVFRIQLPHAKDIDH